MFFAGPILASFFLSFTRWNIVGDPVWVGLDNFRTIFTNDPRFIKAVQVTLTYSIFYLPLEVILGIALALLMNRKVRGIGIFRTLYYMPSVVPQVAAALVWVWMLNARYGAINTLLGQVGVDGPNWLSNPGYVLPSLTMIALWGVGGSAIIYLAGLQNIPDVMYEAATVDGANPWQKLWYITLPLLTPTMFFVLITLLINYFQMFEQVWLMPMRDSAADRQVEVIVTEVVKNAFSYNRMGYASAMSWVLFALIFAITFVQLRLQKRWVYYEIDQN
ncbi:MAG: carbohydrate ABC transporter permease [Chloroflexota bacterium]